jgi:AraC-like DNA-binding protein
MKPELETGISNLSHASFKAFRLHKPAFESFWHYHPELELVYFSRGRGMRFIGDDVSLYHEGELYLLGENLPHSFVTYQEDATPLVEAYCIQFSKQLFDSFVECKPLNALFQAAKRGIAFSTPNEQIQQGIQATVNTTGVQSLAALLGTLEGLRELSQTPILQRDYQRHSALADAPARIRTAVDFIHAHYHRPILLAEISEVCHFSPNAFCRWFKQNMGITFVEYLNKVRLTHVCQLLLTTDVSVGQIALQTGFDNISTLNRLFQQKLHTSPSKYRAGHGLYT